MMTAKRIFLAATLALGGCFNPSDNLCLTHCWAYTHTITDINNDGRFDDACLNGTDIVLPPLPPSESTAGRVCLNTQAQHAVIKKVLQAKELDATELLSYDEVAAYDALVADLASDAYAKCLAILSTTCEPASAAGLCNVHLETPVAQALDLDQGTALPESDGTGYKAIAEGAYCDFDPDTFSEESGSDSDTGEGTTGSEVGPFGAIGELVYCHSPEACEVKRELVVNVGSNFLVFYQEGVLFTLLGSTPPGPGAQLSGLDPGEASRELASALGITNGDVITEVDGTPLDSEENVSNVLAWLAEGPDLALLTITRPAGTSTTSRDLELVIVP